MATDPDIRALLEPHAPDTPDTPDTEGLRVASAAALADLAAQQDWSLRRTEIRALEAGFVPARYLRNLNTYSPAEQVRLLRTRALVIGLGGLGGHLLELLVRAGVGRLAVCDPDHFEESNLNRQLLSTQPCLGRPKVKRAVMRCHEINPSVEISSLAGAFSAGPDGLPVPPDQREELAAASVLVDCLGGLAHRDDLVRAAAKANIPLVTAAVAGQSGWVATVEPGALSPAEAMGLDHGDPDGTETQLGTPGPAVALAAAMQAHQVLAVAAGRPPSLAGKVLLFDLDQALFEIIDL